MATKEVQEYTKMTNAELDGLGTSEEEIRAFLESIGLSADEAVYLGSAFTVTDKAELIDVPLFFIQWRFTPSEEFGGEFVIVNAVRTDTGEKVIITDGGLGICASLILVTEQREAAPTNPKAFQAGLAVPKGLTRSDYPAGIGLNGEPRPAGTTYYLA